VLTVCSKADRSRDLDADHYLSVDDEVGTEGLIDAAVDAIGYDPELPV
jgi:nucleolar GTP-binding protein